MARICSGLRSPIGVAVAVVVAGLVVVNVIHARVAHASLVLGPVGAAGLLVIARRAGLGGLACASLS